MTDLQTRRIQVGLGERSYSVVIGNGLMARAAAEIAPLLRRPRVAIVTDEQVGPLHAAKLEAQLRGAGVECFRITLPAGEETKSFAGLESLCFQLLELRFDRKDMLIALGGGVIGDLAGFAASIFKRGMDFIQIPTTLLAQVDSSVGGKTAIDTPHGKNLIGAFHQPRLVLADLDLLATLPDREMRCGYAEIIKYGLLGDRDFFDWLETNASRVLARAPDALLHAVARSVEMKAEIVAEDETEQGRRALLNLGHTFGHAVEAHAGFGDMIKHGEGVALGMAMAFRFAVSVSMCAGQDARRAVSAIAASGLPVHLGDCRLDPVTADAFIGHMLQDKKTEGGELTLILPRAIGQTEVVRRADLAAVRQFLITEGVLP